MKIYLASSWRNEGQGLMVRMLRNEGHQVYDFKNPAPGNNGFHWSEIGAGWKAWTPEEYRAALAHPVAEHGFKSDWDAMEWAGVGVLLLPSGRSAHLEAGYFVGAKKPLFIVGDIVEPELMYKMANKVCLTVDELFAGLMALP